MTDAMSRREIEDVLSSIRRLVSHDVSQTAPFVSAAGSGPKDNPNTGEKLLLTSALRVDGPGAASRAHADAAGAPDTRSEDSAATVQMPFGQDGTFGGLPDAPDPGPATPEMPAPESAETAPEEPEPAQPDTPDVSAEPSVPRPEPLFASHAHVPSLLARISGAGRHPEAEPDLSRPLAGLGRFGTGPQVVGPRREDTADAAAEDVLNDKQGADAKPTSAPPAQAIEDSALEATLARLEDLLAGRAHGDTGAVVARDDADRAEDVIDEGVLYQLVAHIVRQELQGELGEKITRNIRKLVRAEVARELQLRQF